MTLYYLKIHIWLITTAVCFTANPFNLTLQHPADICTFLGMCGGRDGAKIRDLLLNHMSKTAPVPTMKVTRDLDAVDCMFCTD